jgi:hypothetical protein
MDDPYNQAAEEELIARIAARLRTPEHLPADFEARLGARARESVESLPLPEIVPSRRRDHWWQAPAIHLSPMNTMLGAAGIAAIAAMVTLVSTRPAAVPAVTTSVVHDTVHVLRFALQRHGAQQISLVGDFNGWKPAAAPMEPTGVDGVWMVSVPLRAGRHEYAFLVDGVLVPDPLAPSSRDDFGTESSVLVVTD